MIVRPEYWDGTNWHPQTAPSLTQIDWDGSGNPIYIGLAALGSATASAAWQIRKIAYDGSNNPTSITWADGNRAFDNVWDNRTGISYS